MPAPGQEELKYNRSNNTNPSNVGMYIGFGIFIIIVIIKIVITMNNKKTDDDTDESARSAEAARTAADARVAADARSAEAARVAEAARTAADARSAEAARTAKAARTAAIDAANKAAAAAAAAAFLIRPNVWRKGVIGYRPLRKHSSLFPGSYPTGLGACVQRARDSNHEYISANNQNGRVACTFYDSNGVNTTAATLGDIVDIENTSYAGAMHYKVG
jgi:hypothetical protein